MGAMARSKGQRGEREVAALLQAVVNEVYQAAGHHVLTEAEREAWRSCGKAASLAATTIPQIQRNTIQSDRGGFDLVGLDWLAIEVKRCETLQVESWWAQCKRQAGPILTMLTPPALVGYRKEPVLMYRQNHGQWHVRMLGDILVPKASRHVRCAVDITLQAFLTYFRTRLRAELEAAKASER